MTEEIEENFEIDTKRNRYPYCIVWTPIPIITWLLPWIGHMGIATSRGIIRDFAGPYFVAEDNMAFGNPTKYWQLDPNLVDDGKNGWDEGVEKSSILYCKRMHYLCWDNCHSHVGTALNFMRYNGESNHNMVKTFFHFTLNCKYISFCAFLKTWLPFCIIITIIISLAMFANMGH
ncbi:transmembrane protein 222-like protein [Dermatophagoides farinae]|uniref:Transmembrane protein 222-like protein n=1 Tax=Dermatophagoides farinae TaxID=6954 RepID=A0A9D4P2T1_DERFA|nr:transmembrane protein 222-like [Dermatophagoides farinae]KAH7643695.1 transmembrane protein 222-like protein [Dermatophagoides farinae]